MTGLERRIGRYVVEEKLGEGGVGEVFRARDGDLGRQVAVKRLRPELASQGQLLERFRSEAQTLAQLNHPNIATLYSLEKEASDWFMVMELVEGVTLSSLIARRGPLPLGEALPLVLQALDGVGYAHARDIVHRDLKGANLILQPDGRVKIMDFGIARVLGSERMTLLGQLVGTPEYMSPEQIRGEETDGRCDLYALGILLYALLTGKLPFRHESQYELMKAQLEEAPPGLPVRGLPRPLEAVVHRALAKDRKDRFANTAEMRDALVPFLGEGAQPPTPWLPAGTNWDDEPTRTLPGIDPEAAEQTVAEPAGLLAPLRALGPRLGQRPRLRRQLSRAGDAASLAVGISLLLGLNWLWAEAVPTSVAASPAVLHGSAESAGGPTAAPAPSVPIASEPTPAPAAASAIPATPERPQPEPRSADERGRESAVAASAPVAPPARREAPVRAKRARPEPARRPPAAPDAEGSEPGWVIRRQ